MQITEQEARKIFDHFKALHKNRVEEFVFTPTNVDRWKMHIANTESVKAIFTQKFSTDFAPDFVTLIRNRSADTYEGLSPRAKIIYDEVARCFPGHQVYAIGSRVNGDFIDITDPPEVKEWRARAGKSPKDDSDFDFIVPGVERDYRWIPENTDWLHYHNLDKQIMIPMWDFSRLPKSEYNMVKKLLEESNERELKKIHDQYLLSQVNYCCNLNGMMQWFRNAERDGLFNE